MCIYLICVWWLIYQPHELFGNDLYLKHYFYFHSAKIVYEPAGLTSSGAFLNIAMTIPGGIFLNLLFKEHLNWFSILLISILVGFFNESTQFIFDQYLNLKRTVDITDVMTNATGIMIGYICAKHGISASSKRINRGNTHD
ncbi:VanZ family protein [Pediococcus claussenii]|uniref:VanZ family protein n=1 Tax=Pediococcus claussenii TaxID=187452 RepID=UPI0009DAF75E